jgi:hypothetical protein
VSRGRGAKENFNRVVVGIFVNLRQKSSILKFEAANQQD